MMAADSARLGPNRALIGEGDARSRLSTPALLLDLDRMERNIAAMAARCRAAGVNLRPHSKGGKSLAIARLQVAAGAVGICCTTIGEAEMIAGGGIANVLVTSPVVTPAMIARLVALNARAEGLMVVADNPANVEALAAAAASAGRTIGVIVEFDVGQGRTGTTSPEAAIALARKIADAPHLRYAGVQAYYGHLQHIPTLAERGKAAEAQLVRLRDLVARLSAEGLAPAIVTGGGTGTASIDLAAGIFTEIQPGSYPFMDREYVEIEMSAGGAPAFEPALSVLASVVSASRPGFVVVNAGYKSFATEGGMPLVAAPKLTGAEYRLMGDEHGGVAFDVNGGTVKLGDAIEFLTPHCDPTINLYDRYHVMRGDVLVDIWPVDARGC